ncbi:MAG: DNA translocase FtsK 4TM domain-containing protein [Ruminococcus sp.]|nr:DNA translocase FtsK 4TM domain-containing protein [Ruminococcus sp.]
MAGKRKKFLFGADFIDENLTRDGKPKEKGASDDADNTQELDVMSAKAMPENEKEKLMERIEKAEKNTAAKKSNNYVKAEDEKPYANAQKSNQVKQNVNSNEPEDDLIFTDDQARIVSIITFAIGILLGMAVLFKGTDGWQTFHNYILGGFGLVSLAVPVGVVYSSYLIGKRDDKAAGKIASMFFWTVVACSAIQVFFGKFMPENGLGEFIGKAFKAGADYSGGGILGSFISYFLLNLLGRGGAVIVMILTIFVMLLITTGKNVEDFFKMLTKPFTSFKKWAEGVQNLFDGEYDYYDDDEDYEEDTAGQNSGISIAMEDIQQVSRKLPRLEKVPASPQEQKELDEFSREFDIPIHDGGVIINNTDDTTETNKDNEAESEETEASVQNEENSDNSQTNLDKLISKAVENKERLDRIAAGEVEEAPKLEPQMPLYILPGLDLLSLPTTRKTSTEAVAEMNEKAAKIVNTFKSFGVEVTIKDIYRGPSITRYEIQPGAGVKVSKIRGLEDDIALSLAAQGVRLEAPVPGKAAVGIEVPNINKDVVTLREILSSAEFRNADSKLAFAVGKDITGNAIVGDITKMPHVIIAGTTGSGKSVCTRSIIMSILYKAKPDEVKIILIDPKVVEFKVFDGIPHLLIPIVTEAKKAAGALNWAVNEMMRRYNTFADIGANDIKSYNEIADDDDEIPRMPQIVIFIDELADMMLVAGKEVEDSICRLAQMGRAAGMHLVVATQRPTTDVITGLIKANIPSRIALSVMSQVDSRTIIDMAGADKLLGNGDMLYMPIGTSKPIRIQGCFASSKDINETLNFIRAQATGEYDKQIVEAVENFVPQTKGDHGGSSDSGFDAGSDEDLIIRAAEVAVNNGQISTTMLQRKLKLGYARASRIMDELEERGIVSEAEGSKPRKVLMSKMQFDEWKMRKLEE